MTKPISPSEALQRREEVFPAEVLEVINKMIVENMKGRQSMLLQDEIKRRIIAATGVFQERWLDFEDVYRSAGWKVTYDKPGFNEPYNAFFIFEAPK